MGVGLPTGWGSVSRPVARGRKFVCCVRNPRNINVFVRVPGREESGSRPGGSVTGVTEKLFMYQMFMCLFRPLAYRPPNSFTCSSFIGVFFSLKKGSSKGGLCHKDPSSKDSFRKEEGRYLVAPYCAILRDYVSDTPLLRAMVLLVSQHDQLGAIPPPPFLSPSPLESMRSGGAIPPPPHKRGISAILARYRIKNKAKWVRYPPSAIVSRKGIAQYGGYLAVGRQGHINFKSGQDL